MAEYLANGFNGTRAAVSAGYAKRSARVEGARLLAKPGIAGAIAAKNGKRLATLEITADRVLQEIAKLAFLDPRKLFNADGSLVPIHELDDKTAMSIAGLEVNELFEGDGEQKHAYGLQKRVKIADKGQSLERLGRYLKLFTDKQEHSGDVRIQRVILSSKPKAPAKALVVPDFG